jgi:hypothetical protein
MDDQPVPMLNSPKESTCETAEQFEKNVLGRMERAHRSFIETTGIGAEPPEQARERLEKRKHEFTQRFSEFSGLEFDQDGRCTTQVTSEAWHHIQKHWVELCGQLNAETDPQKKEQLWRQAGAILRGEAETPEDPHG